jgi:urease accessory protein
MIRVDRILGNVERGFVLAADDVDELWLTRWEAQKRRLRKRTRAGRDVAIALARAGELADGDVLYAAADATIVARVEAGDVVVFTLAAGSPADLAANALRLGHVLGNQHWPLRLQPAAGQAGDWPEIVVPLALDRRVVQAVLEAHRLEGVSYRFRPAAAGEAVEHGTPPPGGRAPVGLPGPTGVAGRGGGESGPRRGAARVPWPAPHRDDLAYEQAHAAPDEGHGHSHAGG